MSPFRALSTALVLLAALCGAALAQHAPAEPATEPGEPRVRHSVIEDQGSRIEETKVRSHTQRIVVTPKVGGTRAYEILTGDGAPTPADISGSARTGTGQRVWQVLRF